MISGQEIRILYDKSWENFFFGVYNNDSKVIFFPEQLP